MWGGQPPSPPPLNDVNSMSGAIIESLLTLSACVRVAVLIVFVHRSTALRTGTNGQQMVLILKKNTQILQIGQKQLFKLTALRAYRPPKAGRGHATQ